MEIALSNTAKMDITKLPQASKSIVEMEEATCPISESSYSSSSLMERLHDSSRNQDDNEDCSESERESDCESESDFGSVSDDDDDDTSTCYDDDDDLEEEMKRLTSRIGLFKQASCPNMMRSPGLMMGLTGALKNGDLDISDSSNEDTGLGDSSYTNIDDSCIENDDCLDESLLDATSLSMYPKNRRSSVSETDLRRLQMLSEGDAVMKSFFKDKKKPLTIVQSQDHKTTMSAGAAHQNTRKPHDVLKTILSVDIVAYPAKMWDAYFMLSKAKNVEAHTKEMEQAIRDEDFTELRTMIKGGRTLQTCNKHGESIVHLACRRSSDELLRFLMKEGDVSVRIRDDCGRSPLHDTCWSYNDRFDIFKTLVENSPELLFIKDFRDFGPFDYIPKPKWGEWCSFLEGNADFLKEITKTLVNDMADMEADTKRN